MFNLKAPCKDCPFRNDRPELKGWLSEGRAEEIYENIANQDGFFSCHKTIDYDNPTEGLQKGNNFCAGAIALLEKTKANRANRNLRIAYLLGFLKEGVTDGANVFDTSDQFIKWHGNN